MVTGQRVGVAAVLAGIAACAAVTPVASAVVNVDLWISCDNQYELYVGNSTTTLGSVLGGVNDWTVATNFSFPINAGDYIYVVGGDYGGVWGLGGFLSLDGGANYAPIIAGMGWEAVRVGAATSWPTQSLIDSYILNATIGGLWAPATAGTATAGSGLPFTYGTMSPQGCIWGAGASVRDLVLFRYEVVPAPAGVVTLGAMGLGLLTRRRRG